MTFPVLIPVGITTLHPHALFDFLAYLLGGRLYFWRRRKSLLSPKQSLAVAGGALVGALVGSIVLDWFSNPRAWLDHSDNIFAIFMQGKTVVGGLLGGWIGVEMAKKRIGYSQSTGDDFVFPIILGMCLGRIGCFLTGLSDNTYGRITSAPWGVDFGDGLLRHPTQLYEIAFLIALGFLIFIRKHYDYEEGDLFKLFLVLYLAFRFFIDFLKPYPKNFAGLNVLQIACLGGFVYHWPVLARLVTFRKGALEPASTTPVPLS